jgi:site-specific recombinase XerD
MTDLATSLAQARAYAAQSYARNTRIAYASDWKLFTAWCGVQQRRPLPATPETILCYVVALAETVSVATIDRRLRGIAFYHRQERQADPTNDPEVAITMRGLRRAKGTAPVGKAPITTELRQQLLDGVSRNCCGTVYRQW